MGPLSVLLKPYRLPRPPPFFQMLSCSLWALLRPPEVLLSTAYRHTVTLFKQLHWKGKFTYLVLTSNFWLCVGLSENGPHRLIYVNVWVPAGGLFRKD